MERKSGRGVKEIWTTVLSGCYKADVVKISNLSFAFWGIGNQQGAVLLLSGGLKQCRLFPSLWKLNTMTYDTVNDASSISKVQSYK